MAGGNERLHGGGSLATDEPDHPDILKPGETDVAADMIAAIRLESANTASLAIMAQEFTKRVVSADRAPTKDELDRIKALEPIVGRAIMTLGLHSETVVKKLGQPYDHLPDDFELGTDIEDLSGVEMMQQVGSLFRAEPVPDLHRTIRDASEMPGMAEFLDTGGFDAAGDRVGIKVGTPGLDTSGRNMAGEEPPLSPYPWRGKKLSEIMDARTGAGPT